MRSSRQRLALIASLVALTLSWVQLGVAVHFAAVQHEVCAEHGELVDVPRATPSASQRSRHAALSTAPEARAHDHCSLCAVASSTPSIARTLVVRVSRSIATSVAYTTSPLHPIAILHLAPKSSPPSLRS